CAPTRSPRYGVRVVMRPTKQYATALIPVREIAHDSVRLSAGGRRAVLECATLAFGIKGEIEQRAIVDGWAALLNSVAHPLQVIVRSTRIDPARVAPIAEGEPRQVSLRDSYTRL